MIRGVVAAVALAALVLALQGGVTDQAKAAGGAGNMPAATPFGGITNVKEVVNRTDRDILVGKFESDISSGRRLEETEMIPPNGVWTGNMWIPWADNVDQFRTHYMFISSGFAPQGDEQGVRAKGGFISVWYCIWQSGEYVRYHDRPKFIPNAQRVPGESRSGGERRLVVSKKDDKIIFTFEKYEK